MSFGDDYAQKLKARIEELKREEADKQLLHDRTIGGNGVPRPSKEFVEQHIGRNEPATEQDLKWQAWQESTQQAYQPDGSIHQAEIDQRRAEDDKQKNEQERQAAIDENLRRVAAEEERKKLLVQREAALETQREDQTAQRRAALATEAENKRTQAQAILAQQEQSATQQSELDMHREQFRQAAQRSQSIERDIN